MTRDAAASLAWWQSGVIYQVYPRSFQDSTGSGTGDLAGIMARLDHFVWLGIDAIWISPAYPSPMTDFGYDVSDYCDIDPLFGTLADMDGLIAAAHARGLKIILDYVPNHSSDRHPWFIESRRSPASPKRDWYLWRDPAPDGGPPNNWLGNFGGPAWTLDPATQQYYYHSFLPTQPDLNWRDPALRAAMFDVLRFWLARGVDGFRVDVMWMMLKDDRLRDNPPNPDWQPAGGSHGRLLPFYTADRPAMPELVAALRAVIEEWPDRVLIAELYLPIERLVTYYGEDGRGAHLPFNFQLLLLERWEAAAIAEIIRRYEAALPNGAWPNWVLGNHDRPRIASRIGPAQARVAALLLLTLRGTPTIYMGDELGLRDTPIPPEAIRDPAELREPGRGLGRDPERTPFVWESGPGRGFTTGAPWLPFGDDIPLDRQKTDPASMANLYRALLALRRHRPALVTGGVDRVTTQGPVLSYRRLDAQGSLTILANTGPVAATIAVPETRILVSTDPSRGLGVVVGSLELRPDEALVLEE